MSADPDPAQSQSPASVHQRLGDLGSDFHRWQDEVLSEPQASLGDRLKTVAAGLVELCATGLDQVLGELFLTEHSNYNFTKPLYVAASLVELIRRCGAHDAAAAIDDSRREQLILAALGYNLGLLAYEKQVYDSDREFSPEEKKQLRAQYPQQSAEMLKAAGLDEPVLQDAVRNHNVASDSPSQDALLLRTPFIYAGIAMPQNLALANQPIDNPSREFARMYANRELDPVFGGLFLRINGLAPIGSIIRLESNEKVMVLGGPQEADITSSTVRMLANRNGVQLMKPGECYRLNETPTRHRGLVDHHHFAWTYFSPHVMWEK